MADTELPLDSHRKIERHRLMTNSGPVTLNMPRGRIIRAGFGPSRIGVVYLWIECNEPSPYRNNRTFVAVGDGEMIPPFYQYVGTAHDQSFTKTWHIYEEIEP